MSSPVLRWITAAVAVVAEVVAVVASPVIAPIAATVAVVATAAYVVQSIHYDERKAANKDLPATPHKTENRPLSYAFFCGKKRLCS